MEKFYNSSYSDRIGFAITTNIKTSLQFATLDKFGIPRFDFVLNFMLLKQCVTESKSNSGLNWINADVRVNSEDTRNKFLCAYHKSACLADVEPRNFLSTHFLPALNNAVISPSH